MKQLAIGALLLLSAGVALSAGESRRAGIEDFDATWRPGRWTFSNGAEFPGARGRFDRTLQAAGAGKSGGPTAPWGRRRVGSQRRRRAAHGTPGDGPVRTRAVGATRLSWRAAAFPWAGRRPACPPYGLPGANDGVPHGPPKHIALLVENTAGPRGELWFDDVRLIEGKPGRSAGMVRSEYVAAQFGAGEGWHLTSAGAAGETSLQERTLRFDFTKGASSVGVVPRDYSLLGVPQEIRIRVKGGAPGHPVRLRLATHFMTFEKTVGEFAGPGGPHGEPCEVVTQAPPGEGWRWFGGENDGKLHGPLRIRGIYLDAAGRKDAGQLELLDVRVVSACPPDRCFVMTAERRGSGPDAAFVATLRGLAQAPTRATVRHVVRDWSGKTVAQGESAVVVPRGGEAVEAPVPVPKGEWPFLEAEFRVEAPGQLVPPAQAYHIAPITPHGTDELKPGSPFGMGLYLYRYGGDARGLKEMDRAARLARDAGVKWSREEFSWARIQPRKDTFDWSFYDAVVATARRNGISVYGLLSYWSGWTKPYTQEGIADYCRFAAAAAERYRKEIRHWEVWNEPNIFFWQGPRDLYADLLKQAYAAIRKANPEALVLGCSTAGIDYKFISRTMELGGPFDVLTIHPYRQRLDDRAYMADLVRAAELVKRPDGSPRPVWITEMGWATHVLHNGSQEGFAVTTQRRQAELLARSYIGALVAQKASGAAPNISWYDFRNDGMDPFNFECNMGIVTRDFEPKPAYRAFATVTAMLEGKGSPQALDVGEGVLAYRFTGPNGPQPVIVMWALGEGSRRAGTIPAEGPMVLMDLMGGRQKLSPADGKLSVNLQAEVPVFLVAAEPDSKKENAK